MQEKGGGKRGINRTTDAERDMIIEIELRQIYSSENKSVFWANTGYNSE